VTQWLKTSSNKCEVLVLNIFIASFSIKWLSSKKEKRKMIVANQPKMAAPSSLEKHTCLRQLEPIAIEFNV
jgi:hypothetical protein